jgi:hypothetical protein
MSGNDDARTEFGRGPQKTGIQGKGHGNGEWKMENAARLFELNRLPTYRNRLKLDLPDFFGLLVLAAYEMLLPVAEQGTLNAGHVDGVQQGQTGGLMEGWMRKFGVGLARQVDQRTSKMAI